MSERETSSGAAVLEVAYPACAVDDVGDEIVVLNVDTGIYFSIRDLGVPVWRALVAGQSVESVVAAPPNGEERPDILEFIGQLKHHGILRQSQRPPAPAEPRNWSQLQIVFEVYTDIQDLLLSDPIHDVDPVRGWPNSSS